jgi:hypothetical protein
VRGVWSVAKNSSTAGNLRDLLGERDRKRERESCDAGCLQYMPYVRSSKAGGRDHVGNGAKAGSCTRVEMR